MRSKACLALAVLACLLGWKAASAADLTVGKAAPPLVLHTLDGQNIATADLRGKIVILTFWATWCVPCREELPLLSAYAAQHAGEGLEILGFSLDNPGTLPEVRRVAATVSFPVGLLGSAWAGDYGRMWRLPVSFVIDRQGILRYDGWDDEQEPWTEARLNRLVTPLLAQTP